jgi:hypothetical protein
MPRLIGANDMPDFGITVGVVEMAGAGPRVAVVSDGQMRHMAPAAALRLAREYEASTEAVALRPVVKALEGAADQALLLCRPEGDA